MNSNEQRIQLGRAAIRAGDRDLNCASDPQTGYVDALANIMHSAHADGVDFDRAALSALAHFIAESRPETETWTLGRDDAAVTDLSEPHLGEAVLDAVRG